MPEGHTLHRLAADITDAFAGQRVQVSSPQGRFETEAGQLNAQTVEGAETWGKHLFIEFPGERYVHVHLGLYGKFGIHQGPPPEPIGQVRLRLVTASAYADLRGATRCDLWTREQLNTCVAKLGPDPLRADADPDRGWARISRSNVPIAGLLMQQDVLAGVGNVYRAELLFRHRIDPMRPGRTLRKSQWVAIWADLVELMADGKVKNRIDTVRPEHTPEAMGRPPRVDDHGGEVYVYRRHSQNCLICERPVRSVEYLGRNLFWCPTCQPKFRSRAAPEGGGRVRRAPLC